MWSVTVCLQGNVKKKKKIGVPFSRCYWEEIFFVAVGFLALFIYIEHSDFLSLCGYSSSFRITVFCFLSRIRLPVNFLTYIVPHTLLSLGYFLIFYYGESVWKKVVRLYPPFLFFRSYWLGIVLLWRLPFSQFFTYELALVFKRFTPVYRKRGVLSKKKKFFSMITFPPASYTY